MLWYLTVVVPREEGLLDVCSLSEDLTISIPVRDFFYRLQNVPRIALVNSMGFKRVEIFQHLHEIPV